MEARQMLVLTVGGLFILAVYGIMIYLGIREGIKRGGKAGRGVMALCLSLSVAAILISGVNYAMNMGWLRFALFFIGLPVWYPMILLSSSAASAAGIGRSKKLLAAFIVSHLSFVGSGLLLYDAGDYGPDYIFFGRINEFPDYLTDIAIGLFVLSLVSMWYQLSLARKLKKASDSEADQVSDIKEEE